MISHILIAWDRMRWLNDPLKGRLPGFVCCCATWLTGMVIALPYPIYTIYVELGVSLWRVSGATLVTCYLLLVSCCFIIKKRKKEIIGRRGNRLRRIKARALDRKSGENSEQRTESSLWFPTARHMWELRTWPRPIFPGLKFSASWQLLFLVGHISKWTQFRAR